MKYLIVNGDDFGASQGINRGIMEAHQRGVLTSTSLMVNAKAAREAVELSRVTPTLSVGLHADIHKELSAQTTPSGPQLYEALRAQLERFQDLMGRPPTHLDAHHNVHRDPRALPQFLRVAKECGVPLREHSPVRYFSAFYGRWGGKTHPEQISVENLRRMLEKEIGEGITELSCHPGYVDPEYPTDYSQERETEVRTLCDPRTRQALEHLSIRLISYGDLARLGAGGG